MSEDTTTPHESESHASGDHEEPEVKAVPVETEPMATQTNAAPELSAQKVHEPIPVAVEESGTKQTFSKVLKLAQDAWVKVQPILREKGTQFLLIANRFTNNFLDNTGPKLTNQAIAKIPDSTKAKVAEQKAKLQPTLAKLQPLWDKVLVPFWQKIVVPNWNKGIALLKQRLPENLQELTHRFLTVAVITTFVMIYWFFSSLTSGKPAAAKQPAVSSKPVLTRPAPKPIAQRPRVQPSMAPAPTIAPTIKPTVVAKPVAPATQPKATAVTPTPIVSPSIDLADIQAQLSSEVAGIAEDIVVSVKTANDNRQLKVSLGVAWDSLSASDQQALAQKLWGRSQKLDFKKMELLNSNSTLVARNPVVGSKVIMLQKPLLDSTT
jgi:hypothetical protein